MIQLPYVALCRQVGESLECTRAKEFIVPNIAQNELCKLLYIREWNSVMREALCSFEGEII